MAIWRVSKLPIYATRICHQYPISSHDIQGCDLTHKKVHAMACGLEGSPVIMSFTCPWGLVVHKNKVIRKAFKMKYWPHHTETPRHTATKLQEKTGAPMAGKYVIHSRHRHRSTRPSRTFLRCSPNCASTKGQVYLTKGD